jgi:hypothetical protein
VIVFVSALDIKSTTLSKLLSWQALPLIDIILSRMQMHLSLTVVSLLSGDLMFEKTFAFILAAKV